MKKGRSKGWAQRGPLKGADQFLQQGAAINFE
jgi:hypothetical protein